MRISRRCSRSAAPTSQVISTSAKFLLAPLGQPIGVTQAGWAQNSRFGLASRTRRQEAAASRGSGRAPSRPPVALSLQWTSSSPHSHSRHCPLPLLSLSGEIESLPEKGRGRRSMVRQWERALEQARVQEAGRPAKGRRITKARTHTHTHTHRLAKWADKPVNKPERSLPGELAC